MNGWKEIGAGTNRADEMSQTKIRHRPTFYRRLVSLARALPGTEGTAGTEESSLVLKILT